MFRERSQAERSRGSLPLPVPTVDPPEMARIAPGNPQYLVNIIRLKREDEYLRDSLFHAIFGTSILFDDMNSAGSYRRHCIENGINCSTLYTRDGGRIGAEGLMDPGDRIPESFSFVFGEQPLQHTKEYTDEVASTEREKEAIDQAIQLSEDISSIVQELENESISDVVTRIRNLQDEMRKLCESLGLRAPEIANDEDGLQDLEHDMEIEEFSSSYR